MAKTNKERQQAFVEHHRNDPGFKMKQALRKQKWRTTRKMTSAGINHERRQAAERQRRCRERKKANASTTATEVDTPTKVYVSAATLGKAVKRVSRNLPASPRKKTAVVKKLAMSLNLFSAKSAISRKSLMLSSDVIERVKKFYFRDDISRQSPGMKDCMVVWEGKEKRKEQKKYMLMTVQEAYSCFKNEYPNLSIGKSKFAEYRPKNVLLQAQTPQNVCLCRYHENVRLLLSCLHEKCGEVPIRSGDFISSSVCDQTDSYCMLGKCNTCSDMSRFQVNIVDKLSDSSMDEVKWYAWETVEGKPVKTVREGVAEEAIDELKNQLPVFLKHDFIKQKQSACFQQIKSNVDEHKGLLQMDFSENYTATYQDEIQSAHWSQKQVTVFTAVFWVNHTQCKSYAIVSDCLSHNKEAVSTFLCTILTDIHSCWPDLKNLDIFTDGAASQFKNKYLFCFLCTKLPVISNITITWHFFATSHGKGAVDGIGGVVKRAVSTAVNSRSHVVTDAASFLRAASDHCSNVTILCVSEADIETFAKKHELEATWQLATSVPGTQNIHHIEVLADEKGIKCLPYAGSSDIVIHKFEDVSAFEEQPSINESQCCLGAVTEQEIIPGSTYVAVIYDDKWWPGVVQSVSEQKAVISFMVPEGQNKFKWPKKQQIEEVPLCEMLAVLKSSPEPVNQRGHFSFGDGEASRITELMCSVLGSG